VTKQGQSTSRFEARILPELMNSRDQSSSICFVSFHALRQPHLAELPLNIHHRIIDVCKHFPRLIKIGGRVAEGVLALDSPDLVCQRPTAAWHVPVRLSLPTLRHLVQQSHKESHVVRTSWQRPKPWRRYHSRSGPANTCGLPTNPIRVACSTPAVRMRPPPVQGFVHLVGPPSTSAGLKVQASSPRLGPELRNPSSQIFW